MRVTASGRRALPYIEAGRADTGGPVTFRQPRFSTVNRNSRILSVRGAQRGPSSPTNFTEHFTDLVAGAGLMRDPIIKVYDACNTPHPSVDEPLDTQLHKLVLEDPIA